MKNSIFELVEKDNNLPFDLALHSVNYVPSHWHNSIEIIFVLKGSLEVNVNNDTAHLYEGDIFLINIGHVHEVIEKEPNIIVTIQLPLPYLRENIRGADSFNFELNSNSVDKDNKVALYAIRKLIAEMVQLKYKHEETYSLDMSSRMLSVLSILIHQFKSLNAEGSISEKNKDRMLRIVSYIEEHYKEPISLQTIAEQEYLSVPYLSNFIKNNIGLNFQTYLTDIRLKNAVEDLFYNEHLPITTIAEKHGFPTTKSFYKAFKNKYHMTPSDYRRQQYSLPDHARKRQQNHGMPNYLAFNQSNALGIISKYLQRETSFEGPYLPATTTKSYEVMVSSHSAKRLRHTWKALITIGKAKEGLYADVQQQLRYVQEKCPFEYLRFHGIFDDDMMVYQEDSKGNPLLNFRYVNELFDFLLSMGLKPFVELGFMPSALASDPTKTVFYKPSYTSPPRSLDKWCKLIEAFIYNCFNRYGRREVESWRFEFWNEPEFYVFWSGSKEEYQEFYRRTYETLKGISPKLQIGAPGRIITFKSNEYGADFFAYCEEHSCLPDFLPIHFYPHEELNLNSDNANQMFITQTYENMLSNFSGISPNPDFLKTSLEQEKGRVAELGLSHLDVYLTEWNSTTYHRDLTNDTLYKSSYIVKNIVENFDQISGFGYWVLSDNIEETAGSPKLFHGGLGLMTQFGIPKPAMLAYELLAKLGDTLMGQGDGYVVTSDDRGYQILTYNYCHFDDLYAIGDASFISDKHRYNAFKEEKTMRLEIDLKGIPSGNYRIITYTVNREHGSSFDEWVRMGAPAALEQDDIQYLKAISIPKREVHTLKIEDKWTYNSTLEPHAISLVELLPIY